MKYKNNRKISNKIIIIVFAFLSVSLCLVLNVRYNIFITNENEKNNHNANSKINFNKNNLEIKTTVAYINGKVGSEFPDEPGFGTTVYCHHIDDNEASGVGELTYIYDDETNTTGRWVLNVEGIEYGDTICEVTFNQLSEEPVSFANDSWTTIVNNTASSKYKVGDTKCVALTGYKNGNYKEESECTGNVSGTNMFRVRIINKSNPSECTSDSFSQTACGFVVAFDNIIGTNGKYVKEYITNGWAKSPARTLLNGDFFNSLPEDLQAAIIPTRVISAGPSETGTGIAELTTTTDKVYIGSFFELNRKSKEMITNYTEADIAESKTRKFDYDVGYLQKINNGLNSSGNWTRSCYYYNSNSFYCYLWIYTLISDGTYSWVLQKYSSSYTARDLLPIFRIGTTN